MDIKHGLCFVHVHLKTYPLGNTIEVIEQNKIYIIGKSKVSDVLAIDVDTVSFLVQKLENVFQCSGEEFRGYNVTLSYTSLQLDRFRTLVLYSDSYRSPIVQALQNFDIPAVNLVPLKGLQHRPNFDGIKGFLIVHIRQT
ncbi:unnamed protein product [Parnassius mnemosyne]|uniref:MutS-like protein n=1 Tax=Parnassius mnemosyne TaxID=213953 RepID=A0AAV1KQ61_9NEOP